MMTRSSATESRRTSAGFTLIELLIVVVVIGVLAAIAIPKFAKFRERSIIASMKSDLRNYAATEEVYRAEHPRYGELVDLQADPYRFRLSNGTLGISRAFPNSWILDVFNPAAPGHTCHLSHNTGDPNDGVIRCS